MYLVVSPDRNLNVPNVMGRVATDRFSNVIFCYWFYHDCGKEIVFSTAIWKIMQVARFFVHGRWFMSKIV